MNELLNAAESAISALNTLHIRVPWVRPVLEQLRAAVERAEKQEVVRLRDDEIFDIENNLPDEYIGDIKYTLGFARAIEQVTWTAAQQAERERIKAIINGVDVHSNWDSGVLSTLRRMQDTILEKIDE